MFCRELLQLSVWRESEWRYSALLVPLTLTGICPWASFLTLSSILFLKVSLEMHSLRPYLSLRLILKHCREETGTISQQSTKSWVHLGTCSDLVSTFCCSRADINHSAVCGSTCCTLPTSHSLTVSLQTRGCIAAQVCSSLLSGNCLFLQCHSYYFFHLDSVPSL